MVDDTDIDETVEDGEDTDENLDDAEPTQADLDDVDGSDSSDATEDVESIQEILQKQEDGEEDDEEEDEPLPAVTKSERLEQIDTRVVPMQATEFMCQNCYLVKHRSQLANKKRMLCRDCA